MMEEEEMTIDMRNRILQRQAFLVQDPELISEVKSRLTLALVGLNVVILTLSGALSYFLAGKTLRPIQTMLEDQKLFIADASHELRTPITALKSSIEVHLRDKSMSLADAKTLLVSAQDQVNRLSSLSDSLLELSRNVSDRPDVDDCVNVYVVIQKVADQMRTLASEKGININTKGGNFTANISDHDLTRLVSILVDNAIKYSISDSNIDLTVFNTKRQVIIKIQDYGVGISKNDLKHIFDRFYRAQTARRSESTGGYGLGLSIAKKIIDSHNGTIHVESKVGHGSIFIVKLPLAS